MEDDARFDGIFMNVLQQKGGIGPFFESVFSFLRRQSDFFIDMKRAESVIIQECNKQFNRFQDDKKRKEDEEKTKKEKEEARRKAKENKQKEDELKKQQEEEALKQKALEKIEEQKQSQIAQNQEGEQGEKKDDEKPPLFNGGKTEKYIWTQNLNDLQVFIPIPDNIRGKNLIVDIQIDKLLVQIKGQPPIINGEWFEKIDKDESVWTITDGEVQDYKGRYIQISIEKWKNQMHWWECVIKGDPKINTQKINPEPSKLDELDGETRGTVEKMMFDMRAKQAGKPSSDEILKRNQLESFMKAHPEMDFSKCKFN